MATCKGTVGKANRKVKEAVLNPARTSEEKAATEATTEASKAEVEAEDNIHHMATARTSNEKTTRASHGLRKYVRAIIIR